MATVSTQAPASERWDTGYEFRTVLLLTLAFGLVGLDRWILPPLFAAQMGADLGLTPADLGNLVGALGIAWGVSAIFMGGLSDVIGRRKVLVPAVILFSVMSALSGAVTGLMSLLLIRIMMGVAEGAVAPTGVAAAVEASHPKRRGMNNGLFQCSFALFGLAIAPILATQLLKVMSWHYVFMIVAIPGLIVATLLWFTIRDPLTSGGGAEKAPRAPLSSIFRHRNVGLAMFGLLCAMAGIFVIAAMLPSYLTGPQSYLHLTVEQMGYVTSAIGLGGFLGQFGVPAFSDRFGRRFTAMASFALAALFLWLFMQVGADNLPLLFGSLFFACLFNFGALALIAGPIAAEAAPLGLISSVAGIVIGAGEIFGGGVAPVIAGNIAQNHGIQYTLWFAMGGQLLGIVLSLFFKETAPRLAGASKTGEVSELDQFEAAHPEGVTRAD
ncbi:MAG TPA: MFS transporter [Caulobacteraceae bacterium]|jgi:MFS family permease|nr:MFS transporter [Caulobacteraceae bacterium]